MNEVPDLINLKVPKYLPLQREWFKKLMRLDTSKEQTIRELDDHINSIHQDSHNVVKFILHDNQIDVDALTEILDTNLNSLRQLLESQFGLQIWQNAVTESRHQILLDNHEDGSISFDTLETFDKCNKLQPGDLINHKYTLYLQLGQSEGDMEDYINSHASYQYVKALPFILNNPEIPLPDGNEDDEVMVAGGTVSLKDPLSLNIYTTPMKSQRCNHVYSKESIEAYLTELSGLHYCPVSGCQSTITKTDLKFDELMDLRVKVFTIRGQKENRDLEVL